MSYPQQNVSVDYTDMENEGNGNIKLEDNDYFNYSGKDKKAQDESNTSDKYITPVEKDNADITNTKGQDNLENNNQVNNNYDTQVMMEYKSNNENPNMLSNSLKKEQGGLCENGNNIEIVGEENIESDISSKDTNQMKIQNYNDDKENEDTINDVNNYNNEVYKPINQDNIQENEKIMVVEDEEEDMTHDINNEYDEEHSNNIWKRKAKRKSYYNNNNNNNNYYTYKHHNNDYYNNNNNYNNHKNVNNIYGEKNYQMEHNKNSIELHKIKNKELDKGKKNKGKNNNTNNKSKNKFFFLFRKKGSIASSSHDKENEYIMKSNKNKNKNFINKDDQFVKKDDNQNLDISYNNNNNVIDNNNNNNNTNLDREKVMNLINKYNNIKKKNSEQNTIYNNSSITNTIKTSEYDVEKNDLNIQNDENICSRENRIYSMKTDDNIIFEFQKEHMNDINYTKNISQITIKTNDDEKKKTCYPDKNEKKTYSFEKIKSFVSNNTYLKDKKSLILEKKSQISKELNFFCSNYNILLCFLLYVICFGFVISSLCYDSWKMHEITLKSLNKEKSVEIHIGATNIRRIQKVSENNGDVILSIDKEQTIGSLIENNICTPIKKDTLENFLKELAHQEKLISDKKKTDIHRELTDDALMVTLKNPGDVGLLTDEKIILARKYIFGPTIYNLECKFLEKLKKAGSFHLILLYAILVFLFISISLLLHILLKYKTVKKVQQIKYASFVLVNLALITLISSIFSINREYNIPLCVQNDGSSDICMDGKSTYLIRSSIILLIFSNLFFCKFINFVHHKSHTIEGSIV
ncbi:conserved Plasmodium membrane protein, unknown function [Plasmodium reichenowi]|uniref:CCAAT-box DNA binding protein subunit B n=1 Tax=Plasmodium reichenowi TaxID=5854 RepID=A0A2P9D8Y2_PLARE|nr:conserved Plasmodium membrane protein, unknown function [Plasmodium reichenowi]